MFGLKREILRRENESLKVQLRRKEETLEAANAFIEEQARELEEVMSNLDRVIEYCASRPKQRHVYKKSVLSLAQFGKYNRQPASRGADRG